MATVKITSNLLHNPHRTDGRFRRWGKMVAGRQHIDLAKRNGYSLTGAFLRWGETAPLATGQYLVLASEWGSRTRRDYEYALVGLDGDGQPAPIAEDDITAAIAAAQLPDEVRAKAANSTLYRYAVYCWLATEATPQPRPAADAAVETARQALAALSPEDRLALLTEMMGQDR